MMSKKDYELISWTIYKRSEDWGHNGNLSLLRELAEDFCTELQKDNPAFDEDKFMHACGF